MAKDLVKDIGFFDVVEVFARPDEGRRREGAIGEHAKKRLEPDQRWHGRDFPTRLALQDSRNIRALRHFAAWHIELRKPIQIRARHMGLNRVPLGVYQIRPNGVFFAGVRNQPVFIGRFGGIGGRFRHDFPLFGKVSRETGAKNHLKSSITAVFRAKYASRIRQSKNSCPT